MGHPTQKPLESPQAPNKIPKPAGRIEIDGRSMVAVPVEEWESILEDLEDYYDLLEARAILDDPRTKFISLEDARKEL
ncbi:MAG: hypothetical protein O6916_02190, partial [bacterium]|nr:hypothetical protein [bacterium]